MSARIAFTRTGRRQTVLRDGEQQRSTPLFRSKGYSRVPGLQKLLYLSLEKHLSRGDYKKGSTAECLPRRKPSASGVSPDCFQHDSLSHHMPVCCHASVDRHPDADVILVAQCAPGLKIVANKKRIRYFVNWRWLALALSTTWILRRESPRSTPHVF